MSPRSLRILFVATTLLLFAQFVFATRVVRPHPALLFPFFEGAPGADGVLQLEHRAVAIRWRDGSRTRVPAEQLVPELPDYVQTKAMRAAFPKRSFSDGSVEAARGAWLRERVSRLGPGVPASAEVELWLRSYDSADAALLSERRVGVIGVDWERGSDG